MGTDSRKSSKHKKVTHGKATSDDQRKIVIANVGLSLVLIFIVNPFTLRVSLESIVCYFHTFVNNSGIKLKLSKYLKESCRLTSG